MWYERVDGIVYVQWLGKSVVTGLSTIHSPTNSVEVRRMVKVDVVGRSRIPEAGGNRRI